LMFHSFSLFQGWACSRPVPILCGTLSNKRRFAYFY
jgi:hypothetical protein